MSIRSRHAFLFLLLACLAGIPSYFAWFREPFIISLHEFDFTMGFLVRDGAQSPLMLVELGYFIHIVLFSGLGWCYYRILLGEGEELGRISLREGAVYGALILPFMGHLPWFNSDVFCYLGLGWMQAAHGLNPYSHTISLAPDFPWHPIYGNIYPLWNEVITPYGPLFLKFMAWVAELGGGGERTCLVILKVLFLVLHILNACLAARIGGLLNMRVRMVFVCFLLNPLFLYCYVGRLHNDILMLTCLLAGILLLLRERYWAAVSFFAVGTAFKYAPVLMMPCFMAYVLKKDWRLAGLVRVAALSVYFAALCFLANLLYENGGKNFLRLLAGQDFIRFNPVHVFWGSAATGFGIMSYPAFKMVMKGLFLLIYAELGFNFLRQRESSPSQSMFVVLVLMLFCYFIISSSDVHEWYMGWFAVCIFWINRLDYFRVGMVLSTVIQAFGVLIGLRSIFWRVAGVFFIYSVLWVCLAYLCRPGARDDARPSPLFKPLPFP